MKTLKKFTAEQLEELRYYEGRFLTAIRSQWASAVTSSQVYRLAELHDYATGTRRVNVRPGCPECVVSTLADVGRIYFAQTAQNLDVEAVKEFSDAHPELTAEDAPAAPKRTKKARK